MKIFASCHDCIDWTKAPPLNSDAMWVEVGELTDEGLAIGECPRGHPITAIVQSPLYVLLFDSGCLALLDGYHREAIGSFAASLERFYEYAIRVICRHHQVPEAVVQETWNAVSKRSEAQIGAFLFLYSMHTGTVIAKWKHDELRNNIVHKGALPTRAQAMEFGEACYERILGVTEVLRATAVEALDKEMTAQVAARARKLFEKKGRNPWTVGSGTSPVDPSRIRSPRPPFDAALKTLASFPMWVHPADRLTVAALARSSGVSVHELLGALDAGRVKIEDAADAKGVEDTRGVKTEEGDTRNE